MILSPKMSQEAVPKSILIADDDLGFLFWASSTLAEAGYLPWPATTVTDALKWMNEPDVDFHLLLVSPSLPGTADLVRTAWRKYPRLKVALLAETSDATDVRVDALISKPAMGDSADTVSAWVNKITRLLS